MEKLKKQRTPNFSPSEKTTAYNLFEKYKHIVNNKKTDGVSIEDKNKTWDLIETKFNAISASGIFRSAKSLKKLLENTAAQTRKSAAAERRSLYRTGGGPPSPPPNNPGGEQELIRSIFNEKTISGIESPYDNDSFITVPKSKYDVGESDSEMETEINKLSGEEIEETISIDNILDNIQEYDNTPQKLHNSRDENVAAVPISGTEHGYAKVKTSKRKVHEVDAEQNTKGKNVHFKKKTSTPFQLKRRTSRRQGAVRVLASSDIAEKYDELLEKRIRIADFELSKLEKEYECFTEESKLKKLRTELELRHLQEVCKQEEEYKRLSIENMKMELKIKEMRLKNMSFGNGDF